MSNAQMDLSLHGEKFMYLIIYCFTVQVLKVCRTPGLQPVKVSLFHFNSMEQN